MAEYDNHMEGLVASLGSMIREELDALNESVMTFAPDDYIASIERVAVTGCGDSHMSAVATELAFEQIGGVPSDPYTAMHAGRYAAPFATPGTVAFGISVSGTVVRTREALYQFNKAGVRTVAITGNTSSPLAEVAQTAILNPVKSDAPGVRSYRGSMLILLLLAIRIGEVKGNISKEQSQSLRDEIRSMADLADRTYELNKPLAKALAEEYKDSKHFIFISHGPNYATALFSAAKLIEAAGTHAMGQDTEEWAHLQYFTIADRDTPTFVISPGFRGHNRSAEITAPVKRIGRRLVAIVPEGDTVVGPLADRVMPIAGNIREAFSPYLYAIPGELLAAYVSDVTGNPYFRRPAEGANAAYALDNAIQQNEMVEDLLIE